MILILHIVQYLREVMEIFFKNPAFFLLEKNV